MRAIHDVEWSGRSLFGAAQVAPVHIGAQIFAAHSAASYPLDVRTALGWHAARTPINQALGFDPNGGGQLACTAKLVDGF